MITSEFIFITFTLGLLIFSAFLMNVPRASLPLVIIYTFFIFFKINTNSGSEEIQELKTDNKEDVLILESEGKPDRIDLVENTTLIKSKIEPKPLTFESGRTDKVQKKINKKKKIVSPKVIEKPEKKMSLIEQISVKDIKICKNIYKRTPVGSDVIFSNTVDSLYCYTRIQNTGSKKEVKHVWYYKDQVMTQVIYNVKKSNIYRSWTKKTILSNQIGKWRVDVINSEGTIIGSKKFEITSLSGNI